MRQGRALRRWSKLALAAALIALGPGGCSSSSAGPDAGSTPEKLTPVPIPDGLVANAWAPTPDATWARARTAIGGPSAFFPQSFGGLASSALGLPITVAGEIDGDVPVIAAIGAPDPSGKNSGVAGIHVKVGDRFLDLLTRGEAARFTSTIDVTSHVAILTPKSGPSSSAALGVLGNYLLVALKKEDLIALGPYVARTMPTLPAPKEDLVVEATKDALSGAQIARYKKSWAQMKAQAEAANAPVLLAGRVDALFDILGDVATAKATMTLGQGAVHVRAFVTPKPGGGPASKTANDIGVGDAKSILELPGTAQIAVFAHAPASPEAGDPAADFAVSLAGKDVPDADKDAIKAAVKGVRGACGATGALGIALLPTGPIAFGRAPVTDEAAAGKAFGDLAALFKLPSFKARLDEQHLVATFGKTVIENFPGDVQKVRLGKKDEKDDKKKPEKKGDKKDDKDQDKAKKAPAPMSTETPSHVDLLWLVQNGFVVAAVGADPKDALKAIAKPAPEASLGADANIKAAVEGLGSSVAFALVADVPRVVAARVGKPPPPSSAPVVVSFGKASAELEAKVDIANGAIQDLIRSRGAF